MLQNAPCKLCGKTAKLLRKSHIIPEFMYNGIFDDSHTMLLADLKDEMKKPRPFQTGFRDRYILCLSCDNVLLGNLERYTASILYNGNSKKPAQVERRIGKDGVKSLYIKNLDYRILKNCLLSILWRSHISQNKFFKEVSIEQNEAEIRQILLLNESIPETDYKLSIIAVRGFSGSPIRMVLPPSVNKLGKGEFATFLINGFIYFIDLKPSSDFKLFNISFLKNSGEIEIPLLDGKEAHKFLKVLGLPDKFTDYYIPL